MCLIGESGLSPRMNMSERTAVEDRWDFARASLPLALGSQEPLSVAGLPLHIYTIELIQLIRSTLESWLVYLSSDCRVIFSFSGNFELSKVYKYK